MYKCGLGMCVVDEGEMNIFGTIENQFALPRLGHKCCTVRRNAKNAVKRKKRRLY